MTNLSEERIDYIIKLGKYLVCQKVEREAQRLEKTKEEVRRLAAASRRLKEQSKEEKERSQELKDLRHYLMEYQYTRDNPDTPEYLDNGKVLVTVWKALPKKEEE